MLTPDLLPATLIIAKIGNARDTQVFPGKLVYGIRLYHLKTSGFASSTLCPKQEMKKLLFLTIPILVPGFVLILFLNYAEQQPPAWQTELEKYIAYKERGSLLPPSSPELKQTLSRVGCIIHVPNQQKNLVSGL